MQGPAPGRLDCSVGMPVVRAVAPGPWGDNGGAWAKGRDLIAPARPPGLPLIDSGVAAWYHIGVDVAMGCRNRAVRRMR
jgi:hypothetical protein